MFGGDSDRNSIAKAFSKITGDVAKLSEELNRLKQDHSKLLEENMALKKQISANSFSFDREMIGSIVKETLKHAPSSNSLMKKFNKKRKSILTVRISNLAMHQNLTLPEIKEIVVDQEALCSKATFYRYVDRMKSRGMLDFVKINEMDIVVKA
ncbi:TPA: hypothetical protein HA239_02170 [Candidatus Woesearchaeota archaeon]|nr:hypothetical protein QT06_C0001G1038 [archaeon GW2011_AR15]MBS3104491.1 hypothetical protein [Candidatus Woesearchaeota archaeon]HIH41195.1 hypothetical protein [Candidatus Woesearchaeota archaeon]